MKLYDKSGKHVDTRGNEWTNKFAELKILNTRGLYIREQFNRNGTRLTHSLVGVSMVSTITAKPIKGT